MEYQNRKYYDYYVTKKSPSLDDQWKSFLQTIER